VRTGLQHQNAKSRVFPKRQHLSEQLIWHHPLVVILCGPLPLNLLLAEKLRLQGSANSLTHWTVIGDLNRFVRFQLTARFQKPVAANGRNNEKSLALLQRGRLGQGLKCLEGSRESPNRYVRSLFHLPEIRSVSNRTKLRSHSTRYRLRGANFSGS
jgi:hypothetical protein